MPNLAGITDADDTTKSAMPPPAITRRGPSRAIQLPTGMSKTALTRVEDSVAAPETSPIDQPLASTVACR